MKTSRGYNEVVSCTLSTSNSCPLPSLHICALCLHSAVCTSDRLALEIIRFAALAFAPPTPHPPSAFPSLPLIVAPSEGAALQQAKSRLAAFPKFYDTGPIEART